MIGLLKGIFSSGAVGAIERIASEAIETHKEEAEAKSLFVKTLDPNGLMRRQISKTVSGLYTIYVITMLALIVLQFFGVGDPESLGTAVDSVKSLFEDITLAFITIIGASFGVNGVNSYQKK